MLMFAPGPIRIPDIVKQSFSDDVVYFASKDFSDLFLSVQKKLKVVFDTDNSVLVGNGSGSLGMEVSVMSFFNPGDSVCVITSGKYGDNWYKMCKNHNLNTFKCDASYSPACYPLEDFDIFCQSYARNLKGIFVTHFETTSGVLNPIKEYLRIYRKNGGTGLFIVDAICSLLTEELCSDDYDVVIGASQKALSLPPGLFFMSVSNRAIEYAVNKIGGETFCYFNFLKEYAYQRNGMSVFTTSVHLIQALNVSLDFILLRGIDFIINKCRENALFLRNELCPNFNRFPINEGNAVTVFHHDKAPELVKRCYDLGLVLGSGIRDLHDTTFRVMTFGWSLETSSLIQACNIIKTVSKDVRVGEIDGF